ncbi:Lipid phosphate phosphatase 2 [Psilocybe cubensis]|uniref:Lipid phosphate phosphatase 2 n=1 Tax=Psilocybe cubensis TaxID=181762 RepID=A0ACB8GV06_PSICU|nr:Lipid phosphate phosphatase 2 [Psilocybe cubensis]KAH9479401.1 Lipid phosphate phosphatase 2 [Psilocybe cubensis]
MLRSKQYCGEDALEWANRPFFVDWAVTGVIWLLSYFVSASPVYQRDFTLSDPDISHPHRKDQIESWLNNLISLFCPLLVFVGVGCIKRSMLVIHHSAIGLFTARGVARLITEAFKHSVGRLRPDFLARCRWDEALKKCTGERDKILAGRKSFPSGHSSTAFAGMLFLSLWIAGQTAAWCFAVPKSGHNFRSSRMLSFALSLLPIFWAAHVAVTRIQDYRHHTEDVIIGSLLGCISALLSYLLFWPNPLSQDSYEPSVYGEPRLLYTYTGRNHQRTRTTEFELGRFEAEDVDSTYV